MPGSLNQKLIRCVCGKVYPLKNKSVCPDCGHEMNIEKPAAKKREALSEEKQPAPKPQLPAVNIPRKWLMIGAGVLLAAFVLSKLFTGGGHQQTTSQTRETSTFGQPFGSDIKGVDPSLVGTWQLWVPAVQGTAHWDLTIQKNGTYSFVASGPGTGGSHQGSFGAQNNRWVLDSKNTDWSDGGTYQLAGNDALVLTGKLGTATWRRVR